MRRFIPYFLGMNLPGIASLSVFFGVVVNIFTYILLVPRYGLAGAAIGTVLGYTLSSFLLYMFFIKRTGMTFKECLLFNDNDWSLVVEKMRIFLRR